MIEFDTHDVLCLVSSIFNTQYVLFIVSRYRLILDIFYVTVEGYRVGSPYGYCLQSSIYLDKCN